MCVAGERGTDKWQRNEQTEKVTFAKEKTGAGRVGIPLVTIRTLANESSRMYLARPKLRLRKS